MATFTEESRTPIGGNKALCTGTLGFDSSYPTGGEAIDAAGDLGYDVVIFEPGVIVANWDKANQKVVAYWGNAGTASVLPEVTDTTSLATVTLQYLAIAAAQ